VPQLLFLSCVSHPDPFKSRQLQQPPQADIVDLASDQLETVAPAKIEAPPDDTLCEANQFGGEDWTADSSLTLLAVTAKPGDATPVGVLGLDLRG
jgi:hypothetical protein